MHNPPTTPEQCDNMLAYHQTRCQQKKAFATRKAAKAEAKQFRRSTKLYSYHCPICRQWHNTKLQRPDGRILNETLTHLTP